MRFAPQFSGPRDPLPRTPPRLPGSVRRTTTIDVARPDGLYGRSVIDARGRDLGTGAAAAAAAAAVHLEVELDAMKTIVAVRGAPLEPLVGAPVGGGFRARAEAALRGRTGPGSVLHLLLDDLVGAVLVSGVAPQHAEAVAGGGPMSDGVRAHTDLLFGSQAGICAGWAADGAMLTELRRTGDLPAPLGPDAPALDGGGDPLAWHDTAALPPHGVRRRRRLDVGPFSADGTAPFEGHFRDSHVDARGVERVVHEYSFSGSVDAPGDRVAQIDVTARVLPWRECPAAVASAGRIVGVPLDALRSFVRSELRGVSTCTHLNDVLRSLADLAMLCAASASDARLG